ncbi:GNAT family N-acetyltransferase [Leifsonia shinshuensis]|uniref:GNAT family N-acetyltransferase n=1 Tax=Leifsonia shinshuensis TaxID=150026 RepID=UPI001F504B66|nr:GNAT family protein [Leifsonia shinshuensis]MCI0158006.1 GNAT family N-acetyltransferase [Leifsonia shinshuensis]
MTITLSRVDPVADAAELIALLSTNRFPFHSSVQPTREEVARRVARGDFSGPANEAYWIQDASIGEGHRVGLIVFEEITDGTPLIDLRIAEAHRGRGLGRAALRLATATVFRAHPELNRIEGNTRIDNAAMRRVFTAAGYVKEAHYREGWPVAGKPPLDAVAYAILRSDWTEGTITPVPWAT